jgi:hypothetical protein
VQKKINKEAANATKINTIEYIKKAANSNESAGAVNVKPVSTPTPNMKIGGVVVDESVDLNQVKSRK